MNNSKKEKYMGIFIIGATGHGKSTLAKAIEQLSNVRLKCEVMNTQDLIELKKSLEPPKELLEIGEELNLETKEYKNNHRKKGKEIKSWQRTKFYQR